MRTGTVRESRLKIRVNSVLVLLALLATVSAVRAQGTLSCNQVMSGALGIQQTNIYTFQLNAGETVIVRMGSVELTGTNSLDAMMQLYSPGGTLLAQNGDYGDKALDVSARATESGTFRLLVFTVGYPGAYRIEMVSTGCAASNPTLENGYMHTGSINVGTLDAYSFQANAGDGIFVRMGNTTTNGNLDPLLRLYGPDGRFLTSVGGYGFKAEDVSTRATNSGLFTVVLSGGAAHFGYTNGSGTYRITLAKTGDPVSIASGDEGGAMTNGFMHTGTIDLGDADVWTFNANAGDGILVRMGNTFTNGTLDPWLRLYDPSGALLANVGGYGYKAEHINLRATNSGTFTVVLSGGNIGTPGVGPYRIAVAKTGAPVVTADGDEGGVMTNGYTYTGMIDLGDIDVWTVNAHNGDSIVVRMGDLSATNPLDPYLWVYAPDGRLVQYVGGYGYIAEEALARATNDGTYMVVLSGGNGLYSGVPGATGQYRITLAKSGIDPVAVAPGDEGGNLVSGVPVTGSIPIGDLDVYSFMAFSNAHPTLNLNELTDDNGFYPWLRVYRENGTLLANTYGTTNASVVLPTNTDGLITVVVADAGSGYSRTGTYELTFNCGCGANIAVYTDDGQTNYFSDRLHVVQSIPGQTSSGLRQPKTPSTEAVGKCYYVRGSATITHEGESPQPLVLGQLIYMNDVIETSTNAQVRLLFCDNTQFNISGQGKLTIDEYTYNPNQQYDRSFFSTLHDFFVYTAGFIGKHDIPDQNVEQSFGGGIRADASDYINNLDVLLNPAAIAETASPVTMYTAVNVPTTPFTFGFDYSYVRQAGALKVALGGIPVFTNAAADYNTLIFERVSLTVTNPAILSLGLTELTFNFDGPPAQQLFLDNIVFPGLLNGDYGYMGENWFARGHGNVHLGATVHPLTSEYTAVTVSGPSDQLTASWPVAATNYVLETTTNLLPPQLWTPVTNGLLVVSNKYTVTLPNDGSERFFRLHLNSN